MPHKGDYSRCRFCPLCGLETLEIDRYCEQRPKGMHKAEFICRTCGFSFRIVRSARVEAADELFKAHRSLRTNKFEEGVSPQAAEGWLRFTESRHERWRKRVERRGTEL